MAAVMMSYPVRDSFQSYPQQYPMYPTRAHHPEADVAQAIHVNPYTSYAPTPQPQQYLQQQPRAQLSNSPAPEDGFRPSLPSISNLLGIADGDRSSQDAGRSLSRNASTRNLANTDKCVASQRSQTQVQQQAQQSVRSTSTEQRQYPAYQSHDLSISQRTAIPPTPPLRNDSVVEGAHSPSTISTGSSLSAGQPYFVGSALNNVEASDQRAAAAAHLIKRHSIPSQPNLSPYRISPYNTSPYSHSPGALSNGSYYSPTDPTYSASSLYHQRPLPSNFPPPPPMQVQSAPSHPARNPWEHHHYISASSQATFPQSQDRYICQTCNKAFSRPSSLKIHSHSHSGEKPYKCPHAGCGKAFSVRSNMKRHERGCHTGAGAILGSAHLA